MSGHAQQAIRTRRNIALGRIADVEVGGTLHALSLGASPHGGIAPGIDRIVMLLCGEENLREVVLSR